jgi:hypothetical protein
MLMLAAGVGPSDMSDELFAISRISPAPAAQGDYDSICAALMQTERGRWFLQEYARRNRSADTQILLAAIERIEAVVCAERNRQVQPGFRSDLLEMAQAITRTRAEVAEIRSEAASRLESARADGEASPVARPPQPRDVFATAERIRDVTWAMRGHGFDPSTCDQLEELAAAILSASSLRDPTDHRASKLSEVLHYLEHRIDALLESCADAPVDTHDDLEGDATAQSPPPAVDIAPRTAPVEAPPDQSPASAFAPGEDGNFPPLEADLPSTEAELSGPPNEGAGNEPEPPISVRHDDKTRSADQPQDAYLPTVELPGASLALSMSPVVQAAPATRREPAARAFLPEVDMRSDVAGFDVGRAGDMPPAASLPPREALVTTPERVQPAIDLAREGDGERFADLGPAAPAGLDAPTAPDQPPSPATWQPAAAAGAPARAEPADSFTELTAAVPMPQAPTGDPLAALKAMSDDELIAIFS